MLPSLGNISVHQRYIRLGIKSNVPTNTMCAFPGCFLKHMTSPEPALLSPGTLAL